ncbi:MAG: RIP metalloprotease RseP [Actinobacteria bacterium RBG_16_64_13]|nr:MAG: RIP metalloprotease RseP [Actinobacteria bacterium RBG_16_64_13]
MAIVGLGFLILAHEFGHFIVAKATGMRVEEFSLGFGPFLVSRRIGETVYGVSAVPLGGYVRVTGMHKEEFDARVAEARELEAEEQVEKAKRRPQDPEDRLAGKRALSADEIAATPLAKRYYAHPFWHKLVFIIAGVTMNMIVAFLLIWAVGASQGEVISSTLISEVEAGTPAAAAGIKAGDRIVSIDGKKTDTWQDVHTEILTKPGETVAIVVERDGAERELTATIGRQDDGTGRLGIMSTTEVRELGVIDAFGYAGKKTGSMVALIFKGIGMMFTGAAPVTGSQGLAGPVGIIQLSSEAYQGGYYLMLLALISINLAILNMLPLLPLDGGHVLFSIIERIRGRNVSLRVFERISLVGLAIFVLLFIVATSNDIGRLFSSG